VFSEKQNQKRDIKPIQPNVVKEMRLQFPQDIHFQSNRLVNIFYRPLQAHIFETLATTDEPTFPNYLEENNQQEEFYAQYEGEQAQFQNIFPDFTFGGRQ